MTKYDKDLQQIREETQTANQEWIEALKAAQASKQANQDKIREEITGHAEKLKALDVRKTKAREALGEALMTADGEAAEAIRGEIAAIEEEARDVQACLDTMRTYNSAKNEIEVVQEVVTKYREATESTRRRVEELDDTLREVKEQREHLERLEKEIEAARKSMTRNSHALSSEERALIALYEESIGVIDVTGHHSGSDEDAKRRYLSGSRRGIEGIPAFDDGTKAATHAAGKKLNENLGHS